MPYSVVGYSQSSFEWESEREGDPLNILSVSVFNTCARYLRGSRVPVSNGNSSKVIPYANGQSASIHSVHTYIVYFSLPGSLSLSLLPQSLSLFFFHSFDFPRSLSLWELKKQKGRTENTFSIRDLTQTAENVPMEPKIHNRIFHRLPTLSKDLFILSMWYKQIRFEIRFPLIRATKNSPRENWRVSKQLDLSEYVGLYFRL